MQHPELVCCLAMMLIFNKKRVVAYAGFIRARSRKIEVRSETPNFLCGDQQTGEKFVERHDRLLSTSPSLLKPSRCAIAVAFPNMIYVDCLDTRQTVYGFFMRTLFQSATETSPKIYPRGRRCCVAKRVVGIAVKRITLRTSTHFADRHLYEFHRDHVFLLEGRLTGSIVEKFLPTSPQRTISEIALQRTGVFGLKIGGCA
jgi:hypothetical protein